MKRQSSQTNQPIHHSSGIGWQIVGELELPFGVDANSTISAWLTEVITPLDLHSDFQNKVLRSAQAAARIMQMR